MYPQDSQYAESKLYVWLRPIIINQEIFLDVFFLERWGYNLITFFGQNKEKDRRYIQRQTMLHFRQYLRWWKISCVLYSAGYKSSSQKAPALKAFNRPIFPRHDNYHSGFLIRIISNGQYLKTIVIRIYCKKSPFPVQSSEVNKHAHTNIPMAFEYLSFCYWF